MTSTQTASDLYRSGVMLCRGGTLSAGASELRKALDLLPAHPGIRIAYVRALIDLGRAEEALRHARRPVSGPGAAELWRLRAEAAEAAGSLPDKIEAERNAQLEESGVQLQNRPHDRALLLYRARLFGVLQRDGEAEEIYRRLLAADASNAEAARELGLLLERANRFKEIRSLIDDAVAAGADASRFALLEAFLAWRNRKPRQVLDWLARVDPAEEVVRARHLEAKAHDALGNSEAAFRAAEAKNRAVPNREQWRKQAAALRGRLRAFAGAITSEWAAGRTTPASDERAPPAFLVGFPRSGTTLLDTFLMGHPAIAVLEEIPLMGLVADAIGPLGRIPELDTAEVVRLRDVYFDALTPRLPASFGGLVVDKMPLNMMGAPLIQRLFPDARIIFAVRHPCDCVLSAFFQTFNMNPGMASFLDLEDAADLYDVALDIWTRSEAALLLNVCTVVYEEMVEQPEHALKRLIAFLDLEWDDAVVDHRRTAKARGTISTASYDQVIEPINRNSVDRWRRYEKQLRPVLPKLLPWVERLGYGR